MRLPSSSAGLLAVLLPLLCDSGVVRADETPSATAREPVAPYGLRQIGRDARFVLHRPFRLERRDRLRLAATAGATLALYALRDDIRESAQEHRTGDRTRVLQGARNMGKGAFAPALALIAYGASFATHSPREKESAVLLLESMAYSAAAATVGSFVLGAERPEDGDDVRLLDRHGRGVSLDAALAASVIPPLRHQYLRVRPGDGRARRLGKRLGTGLLYAGAALTALQRVDEDKHWAPDAFLGVMAGLGVGSTLVAAHAEPGRGTPPVELAASPEGIELRVSLRLRRR